MLQAGLRKKAKDLMGTALTDEGIDGVFGTNGADWVTKVFDEEAVDLSDNGTVVEKYVKSRLINNIGACKSYLRKGLTLVLACCTGLSNSSPVRRSRTSQ